MLVAANRDVVEDFEQGADKISLNIIDANTTNGPGDDAFNMIGLFAFSGTAGELRFKFTDGSTIIEGDVNGDAKADFQIELLGHFMLSAVNNVDIRFSDPTRPPRWRNPLRRTPRMTATALLAPGRGCRARAMSVVMTPHRDGLLWVKSGTVERASGIVRFTPPKRDVLSVGSDVG